jgi:hypothetical protein
MPVQRPVWGADCPVSMPLPAPADETKLVGMGGFAMTQYRLIHDITAVEYEELSVPVYAPASGITIADDRRIDGSGPSTGAP